MRGEPTPAWDSGNITIWEEYINVALVVANSLVLLITSVVGVAANIFVILAVYHQKSLQTSINALVVNLAVIDSLRCVIDCPILLIIIMTVYQREAVDDLICDTQMASFSFSCCIQLLTLACISAERYQAIAQPFKASQRKRRIMVLIPLTWSLAILVAVFCLIFFKDSPVYVRCQGSQRGTMLSYDTIGVYMLLPLWAACFTIIIGFYARIFALLRSHNRKIFDEAKNVNGEEAQAVASLDQVSSPPPVTSNEAIKQPVETKIFQDLEILSVSVACITSLSDPITYAAVNPQFRSEFYKMRSWIKSRFNKK
ncbi:D(2) dopamine receptor-like [Odontesthes bonariensis]|uniref:D(2) dopamine receptor-like n=1 Tax=Odontesthes bonariensis TaxID=219752 RepID=UPI003F582472